MDCSRNRWPLARVVKVNTSADGHVRTVTILKANGLLDDRGRRTNPPSLLDRPVHKLVLMISTGQSTLRGWS